MVTAYAGWGAVGRYSACQYLSGGSWEIHQGILKSIQEKG